MLPVIAIVGRPNVGKSTLFNCLTQSRRALITALPGTTRDRQFGEVNRDGRHFILVDTGGITEEAYMANEHDKQKQGDAYIDTLITKQALLAIQDTDKIIFVVDAKTGILPEDKLIAQYLRRANKPITLVVNKAEGKDANLAVIDAYELGFEQPIAISAAHHSGISQLLTALIESPNLAEETNKDDTSPQSSSHVKLAIVGRPNVGKSTLTNRMLGEDRVIAHDYPGTTRDSIYIELERFDKKYTLIDTAGVRKRSKVSELPEKFSIIKTLQAIEDAHVVLYIIDARLGVSEQDMKLLGFIVECGKALVIAINKWDGIDQDIKDHAKNTIDRNLQFVSFARIHFISALHGTNVGNLFSSIDEAYQSAMQKLSTPQLTRLLQQAIESHNPPLVKGRRIKLRYAHAGGNNPPRIIIHGNQVNALPLSYRRYLANFYQKKLCLFGTPIIIELKAHDNPYN